MAYPSKGLTRKFLLRMAPAESGIVRQTQEYMAARNVTLSENDTIRFLIQRAAVPDPLTIGQAESMCRMHLAACSDCTDDKPPACAAGVHLKAAYDRIYAQSTPASSAAAASAAAASAAARRVTT